MLEKGLMYDGVVCSLLHALYFYPTSLSAVFFFCILL